MSEKVRLRIEETGEEFEVPIEELKKGLRYFVDTYEELSHRAVTSCPNCGHELVKHSSAGKRQYKPYPELQVCPQCWHKYNPRPDGALQRISRTGRPIT